MVLSLMMPDRLKYLSVSHFYSKATVGNALAADLVYSSQLAGVPAELQSKSGMHIANLKFKF
jgi:hypothetical protein